MMRKLLRRTRIYLNVGKSDTEKRIIIDWTSPDGRASGSIDMTDLFLAISDYYETLNKKD